MLKVENAGSGGGMKPGWSRFSAESAKLIINPVGVTTPVHLDPKDVVMSVDIHNVESGWLGFSGGTSDWVLVNGKWGDSPGEEYKQGHSMLFWLDSPPDGVAPLFRMRTSQNGFNRFVEGLHDRVAKVKGAPDKAWPMIKLDDVKKIKIGKGTSFTVEYTILPQSEWIIRDTGEGSEAVDTIPF